MPSAKVSPAQDDQSQKPPSQGPSDFTDTGWLVKDTNPEEQENQKQEEDAGRELTPYQKVIHKLNSDESWHREINLEKRVGFYKIRGEIGTGNFSQVKLGVHHLTRERVAIKILDKSKLDQKTQRMLSREIVSMESLHHPHIIRLFEVIETLSKVYLVMEYAKGGELFHKISNDGRFEEVEAKPLFAQITDAVDHMHRHNIIHRDLKAENVFFSGPNTVKVGDFGFSIQVTRRDQALRTFCGSPPYAAPELFQDESYQGPAVDIWALGVLLYFMLTASMPFKSQTVSGLKKMIVDGHFTIPQYLSSDCQWLIYGLLRRKPSSRLSLEHIKTCRWLLDHEFHASLPRYAVPTNSHESISGAMTKEEEAATRKLKDLGVTDAMIRYSWDRGVKSSITGTYRILLHKMVDPGAESDTASISGESTLSSSGKTGHPQEDRSSKRIPQKTANKILSRMCRIV